MNLELKKFDMKNITFNPNETPRTCYCINRKT